MKICPKCKRQFESGNFCEDCENEDGSPVRLEEEGLVCKQCGRHYKAGTKFCSECGIRLGGLAENASAGGISMGDKNVIAGDVIGHKEEIKVSGSATIIRNEDETKRTAKCHVCGSIVKRIEGYDCPDCGQFTCSDCFDRKNGICSACVENRMKRYEENYRAKVIEFLSNDGRIDADEFRQLKELQAQYGIDDFRAEEIRNEVKQNSRGKVEFTTFEKLNFEKAEQFFYEEGKTEEALRLIEPIYRSHPDSEKVMMLYLSALGEKDPAAAKEVIGSIESDELGAYLAAVEIAVREGDIDTAERRISDAEKFWPENLTVKCHKMLCLLAMYREFKKKELLDEAGKVAENFGEPKGKLELSWQVKMMSMLEEMKGGGRLEMDRSFCKENNIYHAFVQKNFLKGSSLDTDMVQIPGKNYMIGRTSVTQELYKKVMGYNPSYFQPGSERYQENREKPYKAPAGEDPARLPVENVSWYDAIYFCNRLSVMEGLAPVYSVDGKTDVTKWGYTPHEEQDLRDRDIRMDKKAHGYRLPTVEEWEYAAKGGKNYTYAGSDNLDEVGWYNGNSNDMTHEVGLKKANGYGLYDMSGNVWEWCWDAYNSGHRYICGGCYNCSGSDCKVDSRGHNYASSRYYGMGFRIVCNAD